ncbi:MAG: RNA polymerase sigma-70 factor [Ferruginibacter sp.]|nr:RNA polymerase sigma-70 factor [Ferruginibacter sp.]
MNQIQAIQNNNNAAFEKLYAQQHEKLYFYILNKTNSKYIAEEVVQLSFIKLWNYRKSLNPEIAIEAQLFRIAKTVLIDLLRKNNTSKKGILHLTEKIQTKPDDILEDLDTKDLNKNIYTIVENLPPIQKKVFKLSRNEGLSHREIAEKLSLTPKNIENHITKAIKQIKKGLGIVKLFSTLLFF